MLIFVTLDLPKIDFTQNLSVEQIVDSEISITLCSFHLNDFVFQDGHWLWESSRIPVESGYTNWGLGEPNNYKDCLYIHKSDKKWYDVNCRRTTHMKPLCQIITVKPVTEPPAENTALKPIEKGKKS